MWWIWTIACLQPDRGPASGDFEVETTLSEVALTTVLVRFETPSPTTAHVRYSEPGTSELTRTTETTGPSIHHTVALTGNAAGGVVSWEAVATDERDHTTTSGVQATLVPWPSTLTPLDLDIRDEERSELATGHLLFSQYDRQRDHSFATIVNGHGAVVWLSADTGDDVKINRARLGRDGQSVLFSQYHWELRKDLGEIVRVSLDGTTTTTTRATEQHHDFVELPDHELAWLSYVYDDVVLPGDDDPLPLATDAVRTAPEGTEGAGTRKLFDMLEDWPESPGWSCDHMELGKFVPNRYEWTHSNSIAYIDEEHAFLVLARYIDQLVKIDANTGEILWRMGPGGDFELLSGTWFDHPHFSDAWPGGVLMYDNRNHSERASRAVEYHYDEDAMTVEQVWSHTEPGHRMTTFLGDASRLPGGNVVITWSALGTIQEVTRDGEVVFELHTKNVPGRSAWVGGLW